MRTPTAPKAARGRVLGKALARLWCSGPFFLIGLTAYFEGARGIVSRRLRSLAELAKTLGEEFGVVAREPGHCGSHGTRNVSQA